MQLLILTSKDEGNCYNACKPLGLAELEELLNKISSPLIWVGDFNAHNPLWGSQVRDGNGAVVEELLDNCRLVVMNDSRPTQFDINTLKTSCLDLTIASPTLA